MVKLETCHFHTYDIFVQILANPIDVAVDLQSRSHRQKCRVMYRQTLATTDTTKNSTKVTYHKYNILVVVNARHITTKV